MARSFRRYTGLGGPHDLGIRIVNNRLEKTNVERVVSNGSNQGKPPVYSVDVGRNDSRFIYFHVRKVHEHQLFLRILDVERPECIINFAALAQTTSWIETDRYDATNVVSLAKMSEDIRDHDHFDLWMQVLSSEVFETAVDRPSREDSHRHPTGHCPVSRRTGDLHIKSLVDSSGFPSRTFRPSTGFGRGQQWYRAMPRAAHCAFKGQRFPLEVGGVAEKAFLHATDLAAAVFAIVTDRAQGEVDAAGPDSAVPNCRIVKLIAGAAGVSMDSFVVLAPGRPIEDSRYWLNSFRINEEFGWRPAIPLEEGTVEKVDWARASLEALDAMPQQLSLRTYGSVP